MSNPLLVVADTETIARRVHHFDKDIVVAVDNTFFSPFNFRALDVGADIVVNSATKYINGHSDAILGLVTCNDDKLRHKIFKIQWIMGAVPSPFDCFLVNRGLKTLHVRMPRHAENATKCAVWLESCHRIANVTFPGLKSHPQHELVKKMVRGVPGMIAFRLKGTLEHTTTFLRSLTIISLAVSLGGFESLMEHPASQTHNALSLEEREKLGIHDTLIRFSVGLEEAHDLINDLDQALKKALPDGSY